MQRLFQREKAEGEGGFEGWGWVRGREPAGWYAGILTQPLCTSSRHHETPHRWWMWLAASPTMHHAVAGTPWTL